MTTSRRFLGWTAGGTLAAVLLTASACTGSAGSGDPPAGRGTSASPGPGGQGGRGEAPLQSRPLLQNPKVRVDLVRLARTSGTAVVARLRLVNADTAAVDLGSTLRDLLGAGEDRSVSDPNAVSRIALIDPVNSRLYFPLVDRQRKCLCTRTTIEPAVVPAGGTYALDLAFPAPPQPVSRLGLYFPDSAPFMDVSVTTANGETVTVDRAGHTVDPARTPVAPPRILQIVSTTETPDGAEDDNGADLNVRVSSDVLFAVDKADLGPAAQRILKDVAAKIDRSAGPTVRVDGHTDDTGTDAINGPLSERRAKSVEDALRKLVTRQGVTYQARGHGSAQPVASNDTPEGRKANRRVSVLFARPRPAARTGTAAPTGAAADGPTLGILPGAPPGYAGSRWPRNAGVRIDGLQRFSNGYAVLTWTAHNADAVPLRITVFGPHSSAGYKGSSTGGATLTAGTLRYRSLRDSAGRNLGPPFDVMSPPQILSLEQGERLTLSAMFRIPGELRTVTVEIPGFQKAEVAVRP